MLRGEPRLPSDAVRLIEIDDDAGGPHPPPSRHALPEALQRAGVELSDSGAPLLAIYADIRAWKGRPGLSPAAIERAAALLAGAPGTPVVLFGHPRLADALPTAHALLAAWGGEPLMQEAVAAALTTSPRMPSPAA